MVFKKFAPFDSAADRDPQVFVWALVFMVANAADLGLTLFGLAHGSREANPFMRWALTSLPLFVFALVKVAGPSLFVLGLGSFVAPQERRMTRLRGLRWASVLVGGAVAWNVGVLAWGTLA